jgi:hypothetical protein
MPRHVSSNSMLIFRRTKLYFTASGMSLSVSGRAVHWLREVVICRAGGTGRQRPSCVRRFLLCFLTFTLTGPALLGGPKKFFHRGPNPLSAALSRNSPHFMEPAGSVPHSQQRATYPHSELDQNSTWHLINSFEDSL